ncbi:MAG: hypothetical protein NNA23_13560 [Nitrospira sp.]|nr:hypothetical protein [Nitrospira sp.]
MVLIFATGESHGWFVNEEDSVIIRFDQLLYSDVEQRGDLFSSVNWHSSP